ncbi:SDR family oxidoreductase [Branchiibius cervicis]|uniref:SDR family oxidoreductase n=1 Tax=Branchiibius cervicis TaxID=908252 RepID=A0ABW2AW59_9MICO
MTDLSGKVAVVTGAGRGIGAAVAHRLATDGAAVALLDISEAATKEAVQDIEGAGGRAVGIGCDVSDETAVRDAFDEVADRLGSADILVNNAGILRDNLIFKMSTDDWDQVMAVHLRGTFLCSRTAQRWMVEKKWGRIVNLSSTSALGNRGQVNYSAAKAGIQGFTKALSIELGPFGIRVNAIAPGFIETDMTRATAQRVGVDFDQMKAAAEQTIPLRRAGHPEDIASVASFLVGEDSAYVTGQVIYVAGGPKA